MNIWRWVRSTCLFDFLTKMVDDFIFWSTKYTGWELSSHGYHHCAAHYYNSNNTLDDLLNNTAIKKQYFLHLNPLLFIKNKNQCILFINDSTYDASPHPKIAHRLLFPQTKLCISNFFRLIVTNHWSMWQTNDRYCMKFQLVLYSAHVNSATEEYSNHFGVLNYLLAVTE